MSALFKRLHGIDLRVVPDDHEYFKGVPAGFVLAASRHVTYIRESEWPAIKASLTMTEAAIDKAKASAKAAP